MLGELPPVLAGARGGGHARPVHSPQSGGETRGGILAAEAAGGVLLPQQTARLYGELIGC